MKFFFEEPKILITKKLNNVIKITTNIDMKKFPKYKLIFENSSNECLLYSYCSVTILTIQPKIFKAKEKMRIIKVK